MSDQLKDKETSRVELLQRKIEQLEAELRDKEFSLEILYAQLEAKDNELRKTKDSLGGRLLSRYGQLKYRYLLPVYRLLRRARRKASGERQSRGTIADIQPDLFGASKKHDIFCFPIIDWNFRFQRPQQLLKQFAEDGHRVFYINTRFQQEDSKALVETISPNIFDIRLPGPANLSIYTGEISARLLERLMQSLDELCRDARMEDAVSMVQLPFWTPLAFAAKEKHGWKVVYDCMDEHSGFSTTNAAMLKHEKRLVAGSDLVIATSRLLQDKVAGSAGRVMLLPNAADFDHFNRPGPLRPLSNLPKPIIGYYGAIAEWFDVDMIYQAASARPGWQFVLIGDTHGANVSRLKRLGNVHLLGEQPYLSLPGYLHDFDVACIPFLRNALTEATNPVKFYEYLSAGKPVVAVELPELEPYREYFYPAKTAEDFVSQVEIALEEDSPEKAQKRIEFARENTWHERYEHLRSGIEDLYPKASVIIISFKNLAYLRLCLESLWAKTLYPNFDVIVVDNGGQPDIVEYLRESAEREPRLKVIFNERNLGFARANNIGIRAAKESQYIVLLNDDTVVTRGWLGRMIRYLEAKEIGLVGPVTNWAGNEAKIAVPYQRIEDMDRFARSYTREHEGESFDIGMLAMYCVAMRKQVLDEVGLLDEQFGIGMFEDDDFSMRVRRAGYRVVCAEDIFIHHWGNASFGKIDRESYDKLFEDNRRKFESKWGEKWKPHKARAN